MVRQRRDESGFTLVELLLAVSVFAFVMLIVLGVFIQINAMYYRGISISKAQEAGRLISDDIVRTVQSSKDNSVNFYSFAPGPGGTVTSDALCTSSAIYLVRENTLASTDQSDQNRHIFTKYKVSGSLACPSSQTAFDTLLANGPEPYDFLSGNLSIHNFTYSTSLNELYMTIAYANIANDPTILTNYTDLSGGGAGVLTKRCARGTTGGGQYCATTSLRTSVYNRMN